MNWLKSRIDKLLCKLFAPRIAVLEEEISLVYTFLTRQAEIQTDVLKKLAAIDQFNTIVTECFTKDADMKDKLTGYIKAASSAMKASDERANEMHDEILRLRSRVINISKDEN